MAKSETSGSSQVTSLHQRSSREGATLNGVQRIDPPHGPDVSVSGEIAPEQMPAVQRTADEPSADQIRSQADQLAAHLRSRQKELDSREAELNSRMAQLESETRSARLWIGQREADVSSRNEELAKREQELHRGQQEVEKRLARLAATESAQQRQSSVLCPQHELDETENKLAETQVETERLHEQLLNQQKAFAEEVAATRRRMEAEHRQAMDDLEQKRRVVQRRAVHVDRCRAALRKVRAESGRMQRETLEIRLATEELWTELAGAAPPAALTRSLGRIRTKLAEQHHQANVELADQRKELEEIQTQLSRHHKKLVEQKRQLDRCATDRREEFQKQASRLVAREQQLIREEQRLREQSQCWHAERLKYQQELRRMRTTSVECKETAVPA